MNPLEIVEKGAVLIDGRWESGEGEAIEIVDPATEEVLASVATASRGQVERAVAAARQASDGGPWSHWSAPERSLLLQRVADAIEGSLEALAKTVVKEVGSPITLARALQVGAPVANYRWYSEMALRGPAGGYEQGLPLHHIPVTSSSLLLRQPIGVVAAMTAFNYPIQLLSWKLGGALASGCSTVVFPSPHAIVSTVHCLRVLEEADLPTGAVNLVVGGADVGRQLTTSGGVDMVSFTGSAATGAKVMEQASPTFKRVVLELGGKSPNIVLPSADIASCVVPSILRFARNAGQGCGATTRILVHRSQLDEFLGVATDFIDNDLIVGDPMAPDTVVGPLISGQHRTWVEDMIERAVSDGASVAAGGGRPAIERGFFVNPALIVGAPNHASICQEELFAPVASVLTYETVDEAVRLANESRYGLNASVYGDQEEALAVAMRLRAGTVQVNGGGGLRTDAPWGGFGASGGGREMGAEGYAEFFAVRHLQWPIGGPARPQGTG